MTRHIKSGDIPPSPWTSNMASRHHLRLPRLRECGYIVLEKSPKSENGSVACGMPEMMEDILYREGDDCAGYEECHRWPGYTREHIQQQAFLSNWRTWKYPFIRHVYDTGREYCKSRLLGVVACPPPLCTTLMEGHVSGVSVTCFHSCTYYVFS